MPARPFAGLKPRLAKPVPMEPQYSKPTRCSRAACPDAIFSGTALRSPPRCQRCCIPKDTASAATTSRSEPRIVVVGAGIAGLGCAYRLWTKYGKHADVYEYNSVPGGRIRTLRNYFAEGQLIEEHAEFINPEHTTTLALAKSFGLTLDNTDAYPPGSHPDREQLSFFGQPWSQGALNQDWHDWAWELFHQAAFETAPWPQLYNKHTPGGQQFDRMSVSEWIETYIPGGLSSDFGALCVSAVLDEFGGDPDLQSALNLVYLLGQDDSKASGAQPKDRPALGGANEKWHLHGGNDQLIYGILDRLPSGVLHVDQRLVAVTTSGTGFKCTFECGPSSHDVLADHVVLALPFTTLRQVDLEGRPDQPASPPSHRGGAARHEFEVLPPVRRACVERLDRATGNCYCDGVVQGGWDATDYQPGTAGILAALPGGQSAQNWGTTYGLSSYLGQPPPAMVDAFLGQFNTLFPGVGAAFNGQSYFVWSPGRSTYSRRCTRTSRLVSTRRSTAYKGNAKPTSILRASRPQSTFRVTSKVDSAVAIGAQTRSPPEENPDGIPPSGRNWRARPFSGRPASPVVAVRSSENA